MAEIPEIIDLNETEEKVVKQLDELGQLVQEAEKLRRRQFLIAGVTVLLMLVILSFFIIQTVSFFRTYPKRLLMHEVVKQNRLILENLEKLRQTGRRIIIRTPEIPGFNMGEEVERVRAYCAARGLEHEVLSYHAMGESKLTALTDAVKA